MKKIIKKSIALVLAITAILCLAGCTGAGQKSVFVSRSLAEPAEDVAIQFDAGMLTAADAEKITADLKAEFSEEDITVVPVYTCMNISMNGETIHIFGIDSNHAPFIGLEGMVDGTVYFAEDKGDSAKLDIGVITNETDEGIESAELDEMLLDAQAGVSEKMLYKTIKDKYFTPSMSEETVCFVATKTFLKICSALLAKDVVTLEEADSASDAVRMVGVEIYADNTKAVSDYLSENNYVVE